MIGPKAYIHSDRLSNNILKIKNIISDKNLMLVVKANGYGHGALNIVNNISHDSKIIFGTFSINEALELRNSGIKNNIFIFSKIQNSWIHLALENDLWINATDMNDLKILNEFYKKKNGCPNIHLKFDTGMTRLGFDMQDSNEVFEYILKRPFLPIEGIYSHFSTADEGDLSYVETQLNRFKKILKKGIEKGINFKFIHCSNSGAVLNEINSMFNTVRIGMLAYGVAPSDEVSMNVNVDPVMSFCAPIVNLRNVPANTPVSYGGKYITNKSTNIGVIQAGFADGFPRPWYEKGYISYRGRNYKIAGRVCMDQFMVDFEDIEPQIGEEVLIFGKRRNDFIPIETIANEIDSTTYVLLTGIHGRTDYVII